MFTLRCTLKLLKKLKAKDFSEEREPTTLLGDWYANIVYTRTGHYILFISEKSLLPILISAKDLKNIVPRFMEQLGDVLRLLVVPESLITKELEQMSSHHIGRTKSKIILGSLNDFILNFKYVFPGLTHYRLNEWSMYLAETPCGPLNFQSPIDVTQELFRK